MTYEPTPTSASYTGMDRVYPKRNPSIAPVRSAFEDTFGAYVYPDWMMDAECTRPGVDPRIFYPEKGGSSTATKQALALCAQCVVRETCLEDALDYESGAIATDQVRAEAHGTRGGLTEKQRRKLVGERRARVGQDTIEKAVADYTAGMTIREVASKYGVPYSAVSRWAQAAGVSRGNNAQRAQRRRQAEQGVA